MNDRDPRWSAALERLRQAGDPFDFDVVTAGADRTCREVDVPEIHREQRADLLSIVEKFREQWPQSQIFPIVGDPGSGKTHLLTLWRADLEELAQRERRDTLVAVASQFSVGLDLIDYFRSLVASHLLSRKGPGLRLLTRMAEVNTGDLLVQAIGRRSPPERLPLRAGAGGGLSGWIGGGKPEATLERIDRFLDECRERSWKSPIRQAALDAGLDPGKCHEALKEHVQKTEDLSGTGRLRAGLFTALSQLALLEDRDPIEAFLVEGFQEAYANLGAAEGANSGFLISIMEVCRLLDVPTVVVFDQLEDILRHPNEDRARELQMEFTSSLVRLIGSVPGIAVVVFAERGLWNRAILGNVDSYQRDRLARPIALPGRPSQLEIAMPDRVRRDDLPRIIRRRIAAKAPNLDLDSLPAEFPFTEADLDHASKETSVRRSLRRLSEAFNRIVWKSEGTGPTEPPPSGPPLEKRLQELWDRAVQDAEAQLDGVNIDGHLILPLQQELDVWLRTLEERTLLPGTNSTVEFRADSPPYSVLNVIRDKGANSHGVGIAIWLAQKHGRPKDLKARLEYFSKRKLIRTLVLLREDGVDALSGMTNDLFQEARNKGRDLRIEKYERRHLVALRAFPNWKERVQPSVLEAGPEGKAAFNHFVENLSRELIAWLRRWCEAP
jgi:hypothetical protein